MTVKQNHYHAADFAAVSASNDYIGSEWVHCPICGHKTRTKLNDETVLIKFPLFYRKCKNTILINAQDGKITVIE